jgi:bifunctional UDP-N-acetylglucosamine pyrophosphorylase/glucosamine-1-phosphate N-acetyltransferase
VSLGAVVLAAGRGTRMRSARPKVLHELAGRPMLAWVLGALEAVPPAATVVVLGPEADGVGDTLPGGTLTAVQHERLGTGHATRVGLSALPREVTRVVVASGDTPLLSPDLVTALVADHDASGRDATMVTARLADPGAYGRVLYTDDGAVRAVVEARDATPDELAVDEVNAGLYVFERDALSAALEGVGHDNAQGEMYLPDALPLLARGCGAHAAADPQVILGVNTRVDLAACEAVLQARLREALMLGGVTMPDPARVHLEAGVEVGPDTVLWPGTTLRGSTRIGAGCEIGPDVVARDSTVADGSVVVSAHLDGASVGPRCRVGPFAYLRPAAVLEEGARVGTYVEVKNTRLAPGAKVPHLSYVGDAEIGEGSNVGAGNITANYDGFRKHRTVIGAGVRTGSDCVFVAPVTVGDGAMTAAGSIITHDVPAGALGVARARQSVVEGYAERAAARAARQARSS